jgi:MoaA/NifB/PqqE/SkfB family radical SAM enzyme
MLVEAYSNAHAAVQYRMRTFAGGRFAQYCRPVSICLLMTELCNARCVHCDIWKNTGREDSPSVEQWAHTIDELRRWLGPVHIVFTGGEALMKGFTPDLVAHASRVGLLPEVLTHGYWEDQSKIEKLAKANPWKITVSVDGLGDVHTRIRGRVNFWERTSRSIETMRRLQTEHGLRFTIRLKHVIMAQNTGESLRVADYGNCEGTEVFFQPIEQNYNTPEDPEWFLHSGNWPDDIERVIADIEQLIDRKRRGWRIANSERQLRAMIPYFKHPERLRTSVQMHSAHESNINCAALTTMQIQANGDVRVCTGTPSVGSIKTASIRTIWEARPQFWRSGCCLEHRCSPAEKQHLLMPTMAGK